MVLYPLKYDYFKKMKKKPFKKQHKILLNTNVNKKSSLIKYGIYALKAISPGKLNAIQLETARRVISRQTKRVGKIFIQIIFQIPLTKKFLLSRMGKGSGPIKKWKALISLGTIIIEFAGPSKRNSINALKASSLKLPLKTNVIQRNGLLIKFT